MQTLEIELFIDDFKRILVAQEDKSLNGTYIINHNQKFIARIFKDVDSQWKSQGVSDLSLAQINAIGQEIEKKLKIVS